MTATYEKIATNTLGSSTATVTFSSISSAYTDLIVVAAMKTSVGKNVYIRCNGDTGSNYSYTYLSGSGSATDSGRGSNLSSGLLVAVYGEPAANNNNITIINFNNYSNTTTYKTVLSRANNAATGVDALVSLWRSTSAINSLEFRFTDATTFSSGSTFTLYGIKAE